MTIPSGTVENTSLLPLPPYRDRVEELRQILAQQGSLGLLLVDVSALAQIEHQYGSNAFERVMAMARDLVLELKGHEVRNEDVICLNDRGGDAFLVFFAPKRRDINATLARESLAGGGDVAVLVESDGNRRPPL